MNRLTTVTLFSALLASSALVPTIAAAQSAPGLTLKSATGLKWADLPSLPSGARFVVIEGQMNKAAPFTARIRMPANYRVPAHWHPAIERVSVLSGALYMGRGPMLNTARASALKAGGFAIMPAKVPHFVFTGNQPVELQLHGTGPWGITYVDVAADPRNKQQ